MSTTKTFFPGTPDEELAGPWDCCRCWERGVLSHHPPARGDDPTAHDCGECHHQFCISCRAYSWPPGQAPPPPPSCTPEEEEAMRAKKKAKKEKEEKEKAEKERKERVRKAKEDLEDGEIWEGEEEEDREDELMAEVWGGGKHKPAGWVEENPIELESFGIP